MAIITQSGSDLAKELRAKMDDLNEAIDAARKAGYLVTIKRKYGQDNQSTFILEVFEAQQN